MARLAAFVPLLVLALTACTGGSTAGRASGRSGATHAISARLTVHVSIDDCTPVMAGPCRPQRRDYTLTCGPVGGSMPDRAAACAALTDLLRPHTYPTGCTGPAPGPSTTHILGTVDRRPFALRLRSDLSWCGGPRSVLRDKWILSAFPCSVSVIHYGGQGPSAYPEWARWAGCPSVIVPNAKPGYVQDAVQTLRSAGLRIRITSIPPITGADASTDGYAITAQTPAAGVAVVPGSVVTLRVGIAANGGPGGVGRPSKVPDLRGMPINVAIGTANAAGLLVNVVPPSRPVDDVRVSAQSIRPGSAVRAGETITLHLA